MSHELGAMKPEPAAYQAAIAATGLDPDRLLFLDDVAENVAAARTHGIRAEQTRGLSEVGAAIAAHLPSLDLPAPRHV